MSFRLSASGGSPEHVEGPPCYSNNTHIYDMVVLLNPERLMKVRDKLHIEGNG
jgi:hypothetical protein